MRTLPSAFAALAIALVQLAAPAQAEPELRGFTVDQLIDDAFVERTRDWLEVPVVRLSVTSQNARLGDMTTRSRSWTSSGAPSASRMTSRSSPPFWRDRCPAT